MLSILEKKGQYKHPLRFAEQPLNWCLEHILSHALAFLEGKPKKNLNQIRTSMMLSDLIHHFIPPACLRSTAPRLLLRKRFDYDPFRFLIRNSPSLNRTGKPAVNSTCKIQVPENLCSTRLVLPACQRKLHWHVTRVIVAVWTLGKQNSTYPETMPIIN
jgi:hypothetical protein